MTAMTRLSILTIQPWHDKLIDDVVIQVAIPYKVHAHVGPHVAHAMHTRLVEQVDVAFAHDVLLPVHRETDVGIGHDGQVKAKFVIMFTFRDGDDALAVESKIPAASNSLDPKILQFRLPEIAPKEFGNVLES